MDARRTDERTTQGARGSQVNPVQDRAVAARGPEPTVLAPGQTYASVTDKISSIVLTRRTPRGWLLGFGLAFALVMLLLYAIAYLLAAGIGFGASISPWRGASPSSTSSGGSGSAMPAR